MSTIEGLLDVQRGQAMRTLSLFVIGNNVLDLACVNTRSTKIVMISVNKLIIRLNLS